jgi:positive regulator of sigma E activity
MTSSLLLYVLASLFGLLILILLDAYGFKKEALELTKYFAGFLLGFGIAKGFL